MSLTKNQNLLSRTYSMQISLMFVRHASNELLFAVSLSLRYYCPSCTPISAYLLSAGGVGLQHACPSCCYTLKIRRYPSHNNRSDAFQLNNSRSRSLAIVERFTYRAHTPRSRRAAMRLSRRSLSVIPTSP